MTRKVIVPLDGTEHALVALPIAKRLAELEGATLHLLSVTRESTPPAAILARLGLRERELAGLVLHTMTGDPATGILGTARELGATLVVMCTHTASATDVIVGSTALGVLKGAACPVVVVRPERANAPWSLRRVLLAHDGTPTTTAAISPAATLVRQAAAQLHVLHVAVPGAGAPLERGSLTTPRYLDQPQHEWPAWVGEFVERLGSVAPLEHLDVRMWLAHGAAGEEVLRAVSEHAIDLIVLAWRGVWEGHHAETLKAVLHRAPCPMMVIRGE